MEAQKKRASALKTPQALALTEAYEDFLLSRSVIGITERTMKWYKYNLDRFMNFCQEQGYETVDDLNVQLIHRYLDSIKYKVVKKTGEKKLCKPSYMHSHARAVRSFCKHLEDNELIQKAIKFKMPRLDEGYLPHLSADEIQTVLNACCNQRDRTLVLFIADTGLRQRECLELNWEHVDLTNGVVLVMEGKGRKFRPSVMGARTRRELLKYRRTVEASTDAPVFQTQDGLRLSKHGIISVMERLKARTGLPVSTHALRRSFATLSKKAGMPEMEIQRLLGHANRAMTQRYIQMVEDDLVEAHERYGPVDKFIKR